MNLSLLINDYNNHPKNIKEFVKYNNFSGWLHANAKIKINIDGYETNLKDGAVLKTPSAIYTIKFVGTYKDSYFRHKR